MFLQTADTLKFIPAHSDASRAPHPSESADDVNMATSTGLPSLSPSLSRAVMLDFFFLSDMLGLLPAEFVHISSGTVF